MDAAALNESAPLTKVECGKQSATTATGRAKYRLGVVQTHVIEYYGPFFRELAKHPDIELTVYYGSRQGIESGYDPGFQIFYQWDRPLLDGYNYRFLDAHSQLIAELKAEKYDAVVVYGWASRLYWLACLACLWRGIPLLIAGDSTLRPGQSRLKRIIKEAILKPLFRRAGGFLTMGAANERLYRSFGVGDEKMFLSPYSPDVDYFRRQAAVLKESRQELRGLHGIDPTAPVVLFVGKLIARKRPMDLLEAFQLTRGGGSRASLVFCGEGPLRPVLEKYVERNRVEAVRFVGFQNQSRLPEIYAMADVLALPSEQEPWGVVVNEAMACGLAVIISDQAGAAMEPRFIRNGRNAIVYPAGDVGRLAEAMALLVGDDQLREKMARGGAETMERWNYDLCVAGVASALRHVIG